MSNVVTSMSIVLTSFISRPFSSSSAPSTPRKTVHLEVFTEWDAQSVSKAPPKFSEWTSPSSSRSHLPLSAPPPPRAAATLAAAAVSISSRPLAPGQTPPSRPKPPPAPRPPPPTYVARSLQEELKIFYDFLVQGIDAEDSNYIKTVYEMFLSQVTSGRGFLVWMTFFLV